MSKVPVFCGFSSVLKTTLSKILFFDKILIESPTKFLYDIQIGVFNDQIDLNSLYGLSSYLCNLRLIDEFKLSERVLLERSIYDFLFYRGYKSNWNYESELLENCNIEGLQTLFHSYVNPEYYIIINKNREFIENVPFVKTRSLIYQNADRYFELQYLYIKFLSQFIDSGRILVITKENFSKIISSDQQHLTTLFHEFSNSSLCNYL